MWKCRLPLALTCLVAFEASALAAQITRNGEPAQLDVRPAGEHGVRVTVRPLSFEAALPWSPSLVPGLDFVAPALSLRQIDSPVERQVGALTVRVRHRADSERTEAYGPLSRHAGGGRFLSDPGRILPPRAPQA